MLSTAQNIDARSFWVSAPGVGEIRRERLGAHRGDEVVVRARFSGISRGTESLVFNGRVPVSEYQRMRAPYQAGEFPAPVKYGYSNVGHVEQGPPELIGRTVFSLFPHQDYFVIPVEAVHVVPADVPPARAVLAANMETALNGVWDARPHLGDRVAVVGAGTVGCLTAWAAKRAGCDVELVDLNPARSITALSLGLPFALPADARRDADVVIHASGAPAGLDLCCRLAAFETTIVELSWYGDTVVPLPLGEAFHAKRLTLKSSQVGHIAASQRARWTYRRRMQLALSMLADSALDALITGESAFDELPTVMSQLSASPGNTLCHRIRY